MIELRTLGTIDLRTQCELAAQAVLTQPKRLALFLYLTVACPRGFHRRDELLGLFWPELDTERARAALRQSLYFLRKHLGDDVLHTRAMDEVCVVRGAVWCDAVALELALRDNDPEAAAMLALGEFVPGLAIPEADGFSRWVELQRERLRGLCAEAGWRAAEMYETRGDFASAVACAQAAATHLAGDEVALRRLLALMARVGDRIGAMRTYRRFATLVAQEYEMEPSAETVQLVRSIAHNASPP